MILRLVIVGAVCVVAALVALLARRRPPDAPTQSSVFSAPTQLDRDDFPRPSAPWLVAVFSSSTCDTCAAVAEVASILASDEVEFVEVEVGASPELHRRYQIEAVPICVIADRDGVVGASFIGPVGAVHLWGAMAGLRDPGSVPPGCSADPGGHTDTH